ncbi:MAG: hypothetical protein ACKVP3_25035 [Hyphomicrobiaceae bacterium]
MSIRAFVLAIVCISVAGFFWLRPQQPTPVVNVSRAPAAQAAKQDATGARTFSSKQPLLVAGGHDGLRDLPSSEAPAKPTITRAPAPKAATKDEVTAVRPIASDASAKRISSTKPGDAEAREQLVRDIQYELKRAGCYDGEMHGAWNSNTRHAMQTFTQRMNASLPVDQPDYVLLTLLQAQNPQSCKSGCPVGQVANGGRCVPRAVVAQQQGGSHVSTSGPAQQAPSALSTTEEPLAGRMSAGAMVGQDLPVAPQANADGTSSADNLNQARPHVRAQPPRQRPSGYAQKGSTRQVFVNTMRSAP